MINYKQWFYHIINLEQLYVRWPTRAQEQGSERYEAGWTELLHLYTAAAALNRRRNWSSLRKSHGTCNEKELGQMHARQSSQNP